MPHSRRLFATLLVSIATLLPLASQAADNSRLYTANQSIEAAIRFIGIPAGQHEKFRGAVKGRLPTAGAERALIDKLIRIDSDRSTALFLQLVGPLRRLPGARASEYPCLSPFSRFRERLPKPEPATFA